MIMSIAEGVYRVAGAIAPLNQRMSRFRANFIPANVLLMIGLAISAALNWHTVTLIVQSRQPREPRPVSSVFYAVIPPRNYVALQGRLVTEGELTLLVDRTTRKAVVVQVPADRQGDTEGEDVTIMGMLRKMPPAVAQQLSQPDDEGAASRIERRVVLVEGRLPGSLAPP